MALPNITDYDFFQVGISGGKDSTAVLLWLIYESGWPKEKIKATFCDTGNEDALTYAFIDLLREKVFPIEVVKPDLDFWELAKKKKRFPSRKARFCTQHLKIIPSREYVLSLMEQGEVLALNGVRKGEAHNDNDRGEVEAFNFDFGFGCDVFRPILEWSLDEVWAVHKRHLKMAWVIDMIEADPIMVKDQKQYLIRKMKKNGVPRNPLYDMGASRVGCFPCINSRKLEIRAMARIGRNGLILSNRKKTISIPLMG